MQRPVQKNSQEAWVEIQGLRTFYIQAGQGQPLVLFHGGSPGTCSTVNWKPNIEPLAAAGFSIYAYDQPGFGLTDNPEDYSMEFRVTHAKAFVDAMKLESFHVMGNSMGAYIAARLALEDARVSRLVLVSSNTLAPKGSAESQAKSKKHAEELRAYTPSIENMRKMTLGTLYSRELVTDELVRERYEMSAGKNYQAQLKRGEAPRARPLDEELSQLKVKTLILWGQNDHGTSLEQALLLFKKIPNAELHIFDRCAHWVQWDQAARFNRLVADFLAATDA
jgi:pimeloyl-ACP methyl ester carboxylesterase